MAQKTNIPKELEERVKESVLSKLGKEGFHIQQTFRNSTNFYKLRDGIDIEIAQTGYEDGSMSVSIYPMSHYSGVDYQWKPRWRTNLCIQTDSQRGRIRVHAKKGRRHLMIKNPPVEEVILHYNPKSLEKSE